MRQAGNSNSGFRIRNIKPNPRQQQEQMFSMPGFPDSSRSQAIINKSKQSALAMSKKEEKAMENSAFDFYAQMSSNFGGADMFAQPNSAGKQQEQIQPRGKPPLNQLQQSQKLQKLEQLKQEQIAQIQAQTRQRQDPQQNKVIKSYQPKKSNKDSKSESSHSDIDNMSAEDIRQIINDEKGQFKQKKSKKKNESVLSSFDTSNKVQMGTPAQFSQKSSAVSEGDMVEQRSLSQTPSTQSLLLFDPNEKIVDDNSMVAQIVKQNVMLLQKCLKSSNKELFFAAIDSLNNASNMFGPALNKHLPHILPLVKKKQDLASDERIATLRQTLLKNGGDDAYNYLTMEQYRLKS